jgi:uncharacterized membrane protein
MMWHHGTGDTGGWLAMAVMLLLPVVIAAAVIWLVCQARAAEGLDRAATSSLRRFERADAALAERFAHGEINAEEFQRFRELIHTPERA